MKHYDYVIGKITGEDQPVKQLEEFYQKRQINREALMVATNHIYQNGMFVEHVRIGESRAADRRQALFIRVVNLNGRRFTYRIFESQESDAVFQIGENIRRGWQQVILW